MPAQGRTRPPDMPALVLPMWRTLVLTGAGLAVALPLGVLLGWLISGPAGAWGVAMGLLLPAAFFGATVLTALLTTRLSSATFGAVVMGSWLIKIVLALAFFAALGDAGFYSRVAFAAAFLAGTVGWLATEVAVVWRTRVPYVDPERTA